MTDKKFKVKTGLDLPAPLPVDQGGTGQTSLNNALNALLPDQTSNTNKILGTNGTTTSWVNPGATYASSAPSSPAIGQLWVDSGSTGDSLDSNIIRRKTITATAGQTVFTTDVTFTDGYEHVYYNGVLLVRTTDYTTSGGTNTVTLIQGASAGDIVEVITITPIASVNTALTTTNTFTGKQIFQGDILFRNTTSAVYDLDSGGDISSYWPIQMSGPNGTARFVIGSADSQTSIAGFVASNTSSKPIVASYILGKLETTTAGVETGSITFLTKPSNGPAYANPRMLIDPSGNVGIGTIAPNKKLTVEGGEFNLGWMRSWNVGQPTNMIVSGGTNCIRIWVNRAAAQNYYRGFIFDVYGGGGYDWPGNGLTNYYGKFMITFTGTDTGRVHLITEYGRSYLNNTGTEVTYNTYSATTDANYYYLTLNFKGANATNGYRPYFMVLTYDAGNGGGSGVTSSNNQVYNVVAV